jgi:hypothetical protein
MPLLWFLLKIIASYRRCASSEITEQIARDGGTLEIVRNVY